MARVLEIKNGIRDADGRYREEELLCQREERFGIYQPADEAAQAVILRSKDPDEIRPDDYELTYVGDISKESGWKEDTLMNAIHNQFRDDPPADFGGHPLTEGDVIVLHRNGKNKAFFNDTYGALPVLNFMKELEKRVRPEEKAKPQTEEMRHGRAGKIHAPGHELLM